MDKLSEWKRAAIYVRVSTEEQIELSPDSQIKEIRDYAKRNGYIIMEDHIYNDEGISGRSVKKRDAFNAVISAAKTKPRPFDVILVWKFSRFARNQEESIVYKSLLKKQGIDVISISEPLPDGPFGGLVERIIEWMDEYYSIRLSGEVKRGMKERFLRGGIVTSPPFGYDVKNGTYVPNEEAAIVQQIFSDYANGVKINTICRDLCLRGIKTKRGKLPDNRFVKYVLTNPVYIGKLRWSIDDDGKMTIIEGTHQPIIDNELWDIVQAKIEAGKLAYGKYARTTSIKEPFMLKGLVRCSNCKATLVKTSTKTPGLQCHNYNRGQCQVSHNISLQKINEAVIGELKRIFEDEKFKLDPQVVKAPAKDYEKSLEIEYKKLDKIKHAYYAGVDTVEEYAQNKRIVLERIAELKKERDKTEQKVIPDMTLFKNKLLSVIEIITNNDISEDVKNEALRSIIKKIIFDRKNNSLEMYFYITE